MKHFPEVIKNARKAKKLTMLELSAHLGMDQGLLSKIESGKRQPTRVQVKQMAQVLGLDEKQLLIQYISDKILAEYINEPFLKEGLMAAEEKVGYGKVQVSSSHVLLNPQLKKLLQELDVLKKEWDALKPLSPAQLKNLDAYFDVAYTYESNRIEGNTLTMQETALVVNKGITIGGKSMREHLEAINHQFAIEFIRNVVASKQKLDERLLKEIHALVLRGIDNDNAGRYRDVNVRISGSKHVPPEFYQLPELMAGYFEYYKANAKKMHPVLLASAMHEKLVTIHPFVDGNGRTGRLIMNLILLQHGYSVAIIPGDNKSRYAYYNALEKVQTANNNHDYSEFIAVQVKNSLADFIRSVKGC